MTEREKNIEIELISKAQKGDEEAFEKIINLYEQKICSTIFYMVKNEVVVEDIAQEVSAALGLLYSSSYLFF